MIRIIFHDLKSCKFDTISVGCLGLFRFYLQYSDNKKNMGEQKL